LKNRVDFSVVCVPRPEICLARIIISRALAANAFDAGYRTFEELLSRPNLENTDFLPLQWKDKDEILERSIFPMAYMKYNRIWHRLLLVAGLRKDTRIYGLRVGAAGRLDGEQVPPPFVKKKDAPPSLFANLFTNFI
jgi:hypothetical protein